MSAQGQTKEAMTAETTPGPAPASVVHVYDDIQEEDNRLPDWWLGILFGCFVFAFGYWFVYKKTSTAPGPLATMMTVLAAQA